MSVARKHNYGGIPVTTGGRGRFNQGFIFASTPAASFTYQRTVTVDNTANTEKTDYPVKVSLTSANFDFATTQSDGRDIQFKDGSTIIPHWIEAWDSVGQTATVWVKVPAIGAGVSVALTMLYGDADAADTSSIQNTFIFGEDFNDPGKLIDFPKYTYPARNGVYGIVFGAPELVASASGVVGAWDETIREQSNVIYDAADPDPAKRFKFYYTGQVLPTGTGERRIGLSYAASIKGPWTQYAGNPVIGNGTTARGEDPYIVRNIDGSLYRDASGQMHMFCEDQNNVATLHYYSTDGINWTADAANPVIAPSEPYDSSIVASPVVLHLGGDNSFFMLYEGRGTNDASDPFGNTSESGCVATATTLSGANWTKRGKVHYGDVPDDLAFDPDAQRWWYIWHGTGTAVQRSYTDVVNPLDWVLGSFSQLSPDQAIWSTGGISYMFAPSADDGSGFGKAGVIQNNANPSMYIVDQLGSDDWVFETIGNATSPILSNQSTRVGQLTITPATSGSSHAITAYTRNLALTSGFQVMMRRRLENGPTNDNNRVQIGIGSGTYTALNGLGPITYWPDGYMLTHFNPGASGGRQIRKYVGGAVTVLRQETDASNAALQAWGVHAFSYLPNGEISFRLNGAVQGSPVIDTAHLAAAKQISISGGQDAGAAKHQVDWVAVRKYDGQDPATIVGTQEVV